MIVSNRVITDFLAALISGKISLQEAEAFVRESGDAFSDDVFEAVCHYVDDEAIRTRELVYELWTRLDLLDVYTSHVNDERFSVEQFCRCLACKLHCRSGYDVTKESIFFWVRRRSLSSIWCVKIEFFIGHVCVEVNEGSRWRRSKRRKSLIYNGPWLGLDFIALRKRFINPRQV